MLYLIELVIHMRYCQMWISKELKHIHRSNEHHVTCSNMCSCCCVSSFYLLLEVQQGLSVRLQDGVQPRAESPQVNAMKSRLVGLVRVMFLKKDMLRKTHYIEHDF